MIVIPEGWSVEPQVAGLQLVHPDGAESGVIVYRERVRPLRRLGALLRAVIADDPSCAPAERVEPLVTDEGEHAVLATLSGDRVQRDIGLVFGDDFYAAISAACRRTERFAAMTSIVRRLVITDVEMLGIRRRRFWYAPPPGWHAVARGFITDWLAPRFPSDAVWLTVFPALPIERAPADLLSGMLAPRAAEIDILEERVDPVNLPSGLAGDVGEAAWTVGGRTITKLCCVLRDRHYAYPVEATAKQPHGLDAHRAALEAAFASIRPIPVPRVTISAPPPSFWVE